MQDTNNIDIGIREIRQLTGTIKDKYGIDYTEYALTSFKRRVEGFLMNNKMSIETLMKKLESKDFLDYFIARIAVGATELFRDPTFWILLKNNHLANLIKEHGIVKIWLPLCASGEELYSLLILLKESGWIGNTKIFVSCMSNEKLEYIQQGKMEYEKLEISTKNYTRFQGSKQLSDYIKILNNTITFDQSLLSNILFFKDGLDFNLDIPHIHLILFRNQLIYFAPTLQYKVLDKLHGKLSVKGILVLGILEEIEMNVNNKYVLLNKSESVYQRKM